MTSFMFKIEPLITLLIIKLTSMKLLMFVHLAAKINRANTQSNRMKTSRVINSLV